ncbi:MAG: hypothetical protein R3A80_09510 [Bdellovibrionota bacterium]
MDVGSKTDACENWELLSTRCRFHEPVIGKTFESVLELSDETKEDAKMTLTFYGENKTRLVLVVARLKRI